jgi:ribonuclease P protein component
VISGASPDAPTRLAETFPKARRVLKRRDFLRIQHQGHRIYGNRIIVQFMPNRTPSVRLGLTVSRKIGNAVVRNRIKRWLREVFRRLPEVAQSRFGQGRAFDVVVTPKRGVEDFTFAGLRDELGGLIERYLQQRGAAHKAMRKKTSGGHESRQDRR